MLPEQLSNSRNKHANFKLWQKKLLDLSSYRFVAEAANPSPPVGPALGSKGVNIMDFCKQFNARTQDKAGKVIPVVITVYADKSFDFVTKTPPVAVQLLEVAKSKKGSKEPNRDKVASGYLGPGKSNC